MELQVEGRNPVLEALRSGRTVNRVMVASRKNSGPIGRILQLAERAQVDVEVVGRSGIQQRAESNTPQGVIAVMDPIPYAELELLVQRAWDLGEDPFLVIAAGIQDPYNLGAVLRTAESAGCHGVVIRKDRAVGLTATVIKASAGAALYVPVAQVTNLVRAANKLKELGLWLTAAAAGGEQQLWQARLEGPVALVVGSEGKGIPRLLREHCDQSVSIPLQGHIGSLNASVAAAVLMFEVVRRRKQQN
jgi:23S rRNA (guanosine2251-2'-O)-methyltransferase